MRLPFRTNPNDPAKTLLWAMIAPAALDDIRPRPDLLLHGFTYLDQGTTLCGRKVPKFLLPHPDTAFALRKCQQCLLNERALRGH